MSKENNEYKTREEAEKESGENEVVLSSYDEPFCSHCGEEVFGGSPDELYYLIFNTSEKCGACGKKGFTKV